ncbi:MAG: tRNA (guanosine(46)-N7)-methyltransferase TrmB [Clostridia bacterium]|nr:tRNA (guanosine(46)-N7)-methyltransferase TrmB [Clostridia bacterium]
MRPRHKKHLAERMEACAENLMVIPGDARDYREVIKEQAWIDTAAYFGNQNPVHMEIGCGMGTFIVTLAARHPEINFIAVEVVADVIVVAAEKARQAGLTNVLFVRVDAIYLPKYFPPHSIERLYLNFSCPYPKNSYKNHRLTHRKFLALYRMLLTEGGDLHQKTDNRHFFEFSLAEFSAERWTLTDVTLDLHADKETYPDNIVTEYEDRFLKLGQPIYRLEVKP